MPVLLFFIGKAAICQLIVKLTFNNITAGMIQNCDNIFIANSKFPNSKCYLYINYDFLKQLLRIYPLNIIR